jgi:hypothetical protein
MPSLSSLPRSALTKKRRRAIIDTEKLDIRSHYFDKSLESKLSFDAV